MLAKALRRLAKVESVETVLVRDMNLALALNHCIRGRLLCSEGSSDDHDKQDQSEESQQRRKRRKVGLPEGEHCFSFKCDRPFVDPVYIVDLFKKKVANGCVPTIEKIACARQAISALDLLGPMSISNIFHACKVGYFIHKELLAALGRKVVHCESLLKSFRDVNMCMMLNSLGMLEKHRKDLSRSLVDPKDTAGGQALFPGCAELVQVLVHECIKREAFGEHEASERGMANIIHALGWLYKDGASIDSDRGGGVLADLLIRKMLDTGSIQRCTVKELCMILHGLANMHYERAEIVGQLCDEIKEWLEIRQMRASADTQQKILRYRKLFGEGVDVFTELGANEVSLVMWALGKLNHRNAPLLESLAIEVQGCVKQLNAQGISNIVYGMAQLGYRNNRILDAISSELMAGNRLRRFKSQGLSNVTFGFARLGYRNDAMMLALGRETINPNTVKGFSDKNLGNLVYSWSKLGDRTNTVLDGLTLEIIKPSRLNGFDCEALANVVGGLGECWYSKPRVNEALRGALLQARVRGNLGARSLGMLFSGFGKLGQMDVRLFEMLCDETRKALVAGKVDEAASVTILLGLGWCPGFDEDLVVALLESIESPSQMLSSSVVSCLCGLTLLAPEILEREKGVSACNSLMNRISVELRRPERLLALTPQNTAIVCWLVGRLRYHDKDLLESLIARYLRGSEAGNKLPDDVILLVYACSVFQHQHSLFFHKLKKWLEIKTRQSFDINRLVDLTWEVGTQGTNQRAGHGGSPTVVPQFSFEQLVSDLHVDAGMVSLVVGFERGLALKARRRGVSKRASELRKEMDRLSIPFEQRLTVGCMHAGVVLDEHPVVVWVMEPQEYFINKVKGGIVLSGRSKFQLQCLRRNGLQIVTIPYFDWDGRNSEDRQLLLRTRLADCGVPSAAGQAIA
ncbi:hypothetical protein BSKO_08955 [Bryopsis sp. KO-2023]|nr:hypothetical protein BSKO_08955 [Bryopsis sp. KO-2023]